VIGRLEYRYTDFGNYKYATTPKTKASFSSNQIMVGVGVKF
jgi:opacity protein-like surface antigen